MNTVDRDLIALLALIASSDRTAVRLFINGLEPPRARAVLKRWAFSIIEQLGHDDIDTVALVESWSDGTLVAELRQTLADEAL